ncbi:hypothetical protein B0H14DRAFT_2657255 [Mycena olivaceomarginata]|nr:hypothetical protein B0H14DRAFT_2657255 [Mycena olivaceomarginata]
MPWDRCLPLLLPGRHRIVLPILVMIAIAKKPSLCLGVKFPLNLIIIVICKCRGDLQRIRAAVFGRQACQGDYLKAVIEHDLETRIGDQAEVLEDADSACMEGGQQWSGGHDDGRRKARQRYTGLPFERALNA